MLSPTREEMKTAVGMCHFIAYLLRGLAVLSAHLHIRRLTAPGRP